MQKDKMDEKQLNELETRYYKLLAEVNSLQAEILVIKKRHNLTYLSLLAVFNLLSFIIFIALSLFKVVFKPRDIIKYLHKLVTTYKNKGLKRLIKAIIADSSNVVEISRGYLNNFIGCSKALAKKILQSGQISSYCRMLKNVYVHEGINGVVIAVKLGLIALIKNSNKDKLKYSEWVECYDQLTDADNNLIKKQISELSYAPLISILMTTFNSNEKFLREAIESVRKQLYEHWELCIADDASAEPHVKEILNEYAAKDKRIKVVFRDMNGHIAEASNSALKLASGEFVALLDHDDLLPEHALYWVVSELNNNSDIDIIYSDEDKIDEAGNRFDPHFKTEWNPILLLSMNYISHLTVYRASLINAIGGFRKGYEGSQDYDLLLRAVSQIDVNKIRHIPQVLYHWRAVRGSTASSISYKDYALESARKAVEDFLAKQNITAQVVAHPILPYNRVIFDLPQKLPKVAIIIPTCDKIELLSVAVDSILENTEYYSNFEIIIVNNNSKQEITYAYFEKLKEYSNVQILDFPEVFNWSKINNFAAQHSDADIYCFLNNDVKVISPEWLKEMVSYYSFPNVAAVGAKLYYANDTIQHAGVVLGTGGIAGHIFKRVLRNDYGYFSRLLVPQNYSAITGACLMVHQQAFKRLNGFDENLPVAFNDIDFCMRLIKLDYSIVWTPYAELYHYESLTRGSDLAPEKIEAFEAAGVYIKKKHENILFNDPAFNSNLALENDGEIEFAYPPRTIKPWKVKNT